MYEVNGKKVTVDGLDHYFVTDAAAQGWARDRATWHDLVAADRELKTKVAVPAHKWPEQTRPTFGRRVGRGMVA